MAGSVLVVDDDASFRDLATRILTSWGHAVVAEAGSVGEAIERANALRPEIVLADIGLPDGDGFALAHELSALPWHPRVVLISSDSDAANGPAARRVGAAGFVPKDELSGTAFRLLLDGLARAGSGGGPPRAATEDTRRAVTEAFAAWQAGTRPITDFFAADMTWRIEGRSLASRAYADRQELVDRVLAPFGARFPAGRPFRPVLVRSVFADGDTAIVLWDGHGVASDGEAYDTTCAWFLRVRDGLVVDGTALHDAVAFDELWTRVEPRAG